MYQQDRESKECTDKIEGQDRELKGVYLQYRRTQSRWERRGGGCT